MIEVELRSFLDNAQYKRLLEFFKKNAKLVKEDDQETHYLDGPVDLRIQKNRFFSKIWMKKGKMHDDARHEIELKLDKDDFNKLEKLFSSLGYKTRIKWFRHRKQFSWRGVTVCLDDTRGYGKILELERLCSESDELTARKELAGLMANLEIEPSSKQEFETKFKEYEKSWQD
ncbi:MAG: CYTH domain-containing protein [Candidatus Altiarchaeota archaeon]|nr:CYTH domain-containing protein [Candidatus Altiarchaeota archaeon]